MEVDKEVLERVAQRLKARLDGKEPVPEPVRLSVEKGGFPKVLCLDMNQWIFLSSAHFGKDDTHADALEAVRDAISAGKVVVPITSANFAEGAEARDNGRQRLAEFMVELSSNHSLLSHRALERIEIKRALESTFMCRDIDAIDRTPLLHRGLAAVVAPFSEFSGMAAEAQREPELSVATIVSLLTPKERSDNRQRDEEGRAFVEKVRAIDAGLPKDEKRYRELKNALGSVETAAAVELALAELEVDRENFASWIGDRENVLALGDAIPNLDVMATLVISRERDKTAPIKRGDGLDLTFMRASLPYADIVMGDKQWNGVAISTKLDKRYGTRVVMRMRDLPEALRSEGCL